MRPSAAATCAPFRQPLESFSAHPRPRTRGQLGRHSVVQAGAWPAAAHSHTPSAPTHPHLPARGAPALSTRRASHLSSTSGAVATARTTGQRRVQRSSACLPQLAPAQVHTRTTAQRHRAERRICSCKCMQPRGSGVAAPPALGHSLAVGRANQLCAAATKQPTTAPQACAQGQAADHTLKRSIPPVSQGRGGPHPHGPEVQPLALPRNAQAGPADTHRVGAD